jgi:DNA replication protein DnaC
MLNEPTLEKLRALRLSGMADAWLEQQQSTKTSRLDFDERFGLLVDAEHLHRENRKRDRRLKEAKLRHSAASIEDFDDAAARGVDKALLRRLATCAWIDERLHVVITGASAAALCRVKLRMSLNGATISPRCVQAARHR